ncbi:MAG: hypothetical protein A2Z34_00110 [Planctomycetes bacterium RBG_16_59_8]|nr:MAG: hypothetical protein A2Z34_00110 [Planctomycetes bacterium RBG_16_59_8]
MKIPPPVRDVLDPLLSLCRVLSSKAFPGVLIGGIACSLLGKPRLTRDIDAVLLNADGRLTELLRLFANNGIRPRIPKIAGFAEKNRVLLLRHTTSGIDIDVSMGVLPFERSCVERRAIRKIPRGMLYLPQVEDLIVLKAVARRPIDYEDIKGLVTSAKQIDRRYILSIVRQFADALDAPDMVSDLKKILHA